MVSYRDINRIDLLKEIGLNIFSKFVTLCQTAIPISNLT